jgi:hypothetical protein
MAYIGNVPAEKYTALTQQTFSSPTGTSFTLSQAVTNPVDIDLYIDNVKQNPASYSVSGTALTTSTISSPSTMYCIFNGRATETVNPPDDSVGLSQLASGTDGNVITFDASGNPAYVATGNDGQVLTSAGAGAAPAFEDASGGAWEFVGKTTASGASTVAFTNMASGYDYHYTLGHVISTSDGVALRTQLGVAGPTYRTSGYLAALSEIANDGASQSGEPTDYLPVVDSGVQHLGTGTGEAVVAELTLYDPAGTTNRTFMLGHYTTYGSIPEVRHGRCGGLYNTGAEAHTSIKFYASTGNLTGDFIQFRRKRSA